MASDNPTGADNQQERPVHAQWVVGFVDGEGCFSVPIRLRRRLTESRKVSRVLESSEAIRQPPL